MNSRKTLALAEFPLKRDVATDCHPQGPMSQQITDGSGRNELHPQKMVQLVGFRDPNARRSCIGGSSPRFCSVNQVMLNDRENILSALREKPLKVYEIMKRANVVNEEACQSLLLKMRDEGLVKFDIHKGRWLVG